MTSRPLAEPPILPLPAQLSLSLLNICLGWYEFAFCLVKIKGILGGYERKDRTRWGMQRREQFCSLAPLNSYLSFRSPSLPVKHERPVFVWDLKPKRCSAGPPVVKWVIMCERGHFLISGRRNHWRNDWIYWRLKGMEGHLEFWLL